MPFALGLVVGLWPIGVWRLACRLWRWVGFGPQVCGTWPRNFALWPLSLGPWELGVGPRLFFIIVFGIGALVLGPWALALGPWPLHIWPLAFGKWRFARGLVTRCYLPCVGVPNCPLCCALCAQVPLAIGPTDIGHCPSVGDPWPLVLCCGQWLLSMGHIMVSLRQCPIASLAIDQMLPWPLALGVCPLNIGHGFGQICHWLLALPIGPKSLALGPRY
jgi:hypothetical protein